MKIEFEIKTRGSMLVKYGDKSLIIYGELVFDPPTFYADEKSIKNWEDPFKGLSVKDYEKEEIISFISNQNFHTRIIFD